MALNVLVKNNARSTLLAGITNIATALSVQVGHGTRFSAPVTGELVKLTLYDTAGNVEICHGITRSGDSWSVIVRAQEGTAARAWNAGDGIAENATAGFLSGLSQLDRTETATAKKTFSAGSEMNGSTEFGNGLGTGYLNNIGFTSTVSANALTCALKGRDGNDPSATNPVEATFRSTTLTTALQVVRKITSALSAVLPQGATLDFVTNTSLLVYQDSTVTITIASPALLTIANHGFVDGQMVRLSTTGALPTGLAILTDYFVKYLSPSTFNIAATLGGANINTSGSQSGTHTVSTSETGYIYHYLVDDGATRALGMAKKSIFDESVLHTTVALTAASDRDNVLYTPSAMANAAVRLIGRSLIQAGMNAAGDWPNAPTRRESWSPAMNKTVGVLATATTADGSSIYGGTVSFASPVNVEPGDMIFCTYTAEAQRNGADFGALLSLGIVTGTAVLESTGVDTQPTRRTMEFLGSAVYAGGNIHKSQTFVTRVTRAGTISAYGVATSTTYGTAPINQASHISVQIVRPNA